MQQVDMYLGNPNYVPRLFISANQDCGTIGWVDFISKRKPFMHNESASIADFPRKESIIVCYAPIDEEVIELDWVEGQTEESQLTNHWVEYQYDNFVEIFTKFVKQSKAYPHYGYYISGYLACRPEYVHALWESKDCPPKPSKTVASPAIKKKEENNMSILDKLKQSSMSSAKTAASTTLAEKITDLVVERLPAPVRAVADKVPRHVLVVVVSSAIHMAAERFDIPGKSRVKEVSAYAIDGAFYEFSKGMIKSLIPLFDAIKKMAPEDLVALTNEKE
jgi:hypothetical protein